MPTLISLVLPVYNEEKTIPKLMEELLDLNEKVKSKFKFNCEFIFVNDGSKDGSFELLQSYQKAHAKLFKVINFSRNYGHQIAITAGQDFAKGQAIIIMDSDLQDPPLTCLDLIAKWQEGYEIVYAKRRTYKVGLLKKLPAFIFYRLINSIAKIKIPEDTGDFRLISKRVNDEIKKYKEHARFMRGISSLVGFNQAEVLFDRSQRYAGQPQYTFKKSLQLAFDGITGFSVFPLRIISGLGFLITITSLVFTIVYVSYSIITRQVVPGWTSTFSLISFFGGLQMLMLGIIAEYIGRIYIEVLNRPLYTIADKLGFNQESGKS